MGKRSRTKGAVGERIIVAAHRERGIPAKRTAPLQSYTPNNEPDVLINNNLKGEVKFRKAVPKSVEEWLGENDILFMKRDRGSITVTMSFEKYLELVWKTGRLDLTKGS